MFAYAELKDISIKVANLPFPSSSSGSGSSSNNGFLGQQSAAKSGVSATPVPHGKHMDARLQPILPNATFCEPVYPDFTSIGTEIPAYAVSPSIPTTDLIQDKNSTNMSYIIPVEAACKYTGNTDQEIFKIYNESIADQRKKMFNAEFILL